jgi:hypothetical protein
MNNVDLTDEMKPEYDLKQLRVRKVGPGRSREAIILDQDVSEVFNDSGSVNEALRFLIKVTKQHQNELTDRK